MIDLAIGAGQGGGRLAREFAEVFEVPGRYINLADVDYANFGVPASHKLILDGGGTGRDPVLGETMAKRHLKDIHTFLDDVIESRDVENVVLCVGGGGGSGTGMLFILLDHLLKLGLNVLVIYTIPQKNEGLPAKPNALRALNRLIGQYMMKSVPKDQQPSVLLVDNDFCIERYKNESIGAKDYWAGVNRGIVAAFKRIWDLTDLDNIKHLDAASGFGALDENEFLKIVFFKEGFLDIRSIIFDSPDASELGKAIKTSSLVFGNLDIATTKAYIISLAIPTTWKGKTETKDFIDEVFARIGKSTKTPYTLRSSFYSSRIDKAKVSLLLAGMARSHGLEKILNQTAKDTAKYREKGDVEELDLSQIDF